METDEVLTKLTDNISELFNKIGYSLPNNKLNPIVHQVIEVYLLLDLLNDLYDIESKELLKQLMDELQKDKHNG